MKTYKEFVTESNQAIENLHEGWMSGLRALGRSVGRQWVKRPIDIMTGIYGAQRATQAATNPAGYDEPGVYAGLGQMVPSVNPASKAVKYGSMAFDAARRIKASSKMKKKEEEAAKK
jgi:hypothetical protein